MTGPAYHARTHRPGGTDPIPGLLLPTAGGDGVQDLLLAESPVGLWKLDESSGMTAFDSSGNNNDMLVPVNYLPPTWGQVAGPPGTPSALMLPRAGIDEGTRLAVTLPSALLDDFSAGVWTRKQFIGTSSRLLGQGNWQGANSWTLWWDANDGKYNASMAGANIEANAAAVVDTWYLIGHTRESGTTTLFVNGLSQSDTTATGPGLGSTATWIADDGGGAADNESDFMSWAFITDTPLSGADWLAIYEAGQTGGALAEGLVWTSDGLGGASWEPPTIEVTY